MFTLSRAPASETTLYLPTAAAAKLAILKPQPGEPIQLMKAQPPGGKQVEWQFNRLQPEAVKKPMGKVNGHAASNGIPYWDQKTELTHAYHLAVDVLVEAAGYAASKNLRVQFLGEDIRQLAAVIVIDAGKNRRTPGLRAA